MLIFLVCGTVSAQDSWTAPIAADDLVSPFAMNDEKAIQKGEKIFGKLCWTCHGETGRGDGVISQDLNPNPADLTTAAAQAQSDGSFYWKVTQGKGEMTGYADALSETQRWQLVAFIRSLAKERAE